MIHILLAAALAVAPAPVKHSADAEHAGHHEGMKHDGPCCPKDGKPMDCCKDKKMPCCEKKAESQTPAGASSADGGHGAHEHAH